MIYKKSIVFCFFKKISPFNLDIFPKIIYNTKAQIKRGVAQLVARDVWDVDAAGSNPVTPTKFGFGKQFPKPFSLLSPTQFLRADD